MRALMDRRTPSVSASALAQMGRCEQLVVFEHRCGARRLAHQGQARRRGTAAHKRFEREGEREMRAGLGCTGTQPGSAEFLGRAVAWLRRFASQLSAWFIRWSAR
jgi:hypothetical protein